MKKFTDSLEWEIATEGRCKEIVDFLHLKEGLQIKNSSLMEEYSVGEVRSRIYYFQEVFLLGFGANKEITVLESFFMPQDLFDHVIHLGIIKFNDYESLCHLHMILSEDLQKRNFNKIRMDVLNDANKQEILERLGMIREAILKVQSKASLEIHCYSKFLKE